MASAPSTPGLADQRIRKARAVHVQGQAGIAADAADDVDFIQRVDAAGFGGLGDADAGGLDRVHVAHFAAGFHGQFCRIDLGGLATQEL
ncbi:hypothetical protein G6F46_015457 [Rhizopus delemar]|nr:hypothetical protein G6F46_015457 [Rhizopus delemar]